MQILDKKFYCKDCDYNCSRKFLWEQHLATAKHKKACLSTIGNQKYAIFKCDACEKIYKTRSGLWRHKSKCDTPPMEEKKDNGSNIEMKGMFLKIMDENTELRKILMKQQEQIHDLIPKIGDKNTTINNNNKFNLQFFLNEECKDAINFSDFVNSLTIELDDLDLTKDKGLVEGISSVFVNGLKQLDMYKRPIHCTDMKRETLYIKDANSWGKDDKTKIKQSISDIATMKRKAIQDWTDAHPNWMDDIQLQQEYVQLINKVMSPIEDDNLGENKIIKNIAKEVTINK